MVDIDSIDRAILEALQEDATQSVQAIADRVGLSQNPCWRRIKRLEAEGVIRGRVALLDPDKLGAGVTVFVSIRTGQHSRKWLDRFAAGVMKIPQVVEIYRMSGQVDYMLKVMVADIAEYDRVYRSLIEVADLSDVSSSFAMERIKFTTAVPLPDVVD